jgi:hypothetical protein
METRRKILGVICFFLLASSVAVSQKKSSLVKTFSKSTDTLLFYVKRTNCDSAVFSHYKVYRDKNVYRVINHHGDIHLLRKRCKGLTYPSADQVKYKKLRRYSFPVAQIDTLMLVEDLIRAKSNKALKCDNNFQFILKLKNKSYVSKQKECGQEILNKFLLLFVGELEEDGKNMNQE